MLSNKKLRLSVWQIDLGLKDFRFAIQFLATYVMKLACGSPPGVMMADTLSFNAKIGVVDFWV